MKTPLLPSIHGPEDLRKLPADQLETVAREIRDRIIEVLAINGGHLGSNLGAVELTIALHRVFNSPEDRFIWDVSHQTYVHKLLTGRNDRFETIRKHQGLCGFSHPKESEHDHFHAGHAGTALSLALGAAKSRDLRGDGQHVIPIIGDASLTCGLTLEALNNIDKNLKNFIVILNDNAMSISKNVGAITQILSRLLSNPTTTKLHHELDSYISKIPSLGEHLTKQGHKIVGSMKNLVSCAAFFEQFGLSYIGPINGHDPKKLIDVLEGVKGTNWPVLIHVLTNKGQGMDAAIENPVSYHGVKPFDKCTGKMHPAASSKPTFPKIFGKKLLEMAEQDPKIIAVTPAMSAGSCLDGLMAKYPERCVDVGIAEGHAVTYSGGLASGGAKVVCSIYATFFQRAFDNLFHDVCIQEQPVVFAVDRGGLSGPDGTTHHGVYDISFLNAMPNMVISQPRDGKVLRELMDSAFEWNRPCAIRYPNMGVENPEGELHPRRPGKGEILAEGSDLLIVALGHMNKTALEVREELSRQGVSAAVMDPVFVKPFDMELFINHIAPHKRLVTIEEHSVISGIGSIINHLMMSCGFHDIESLNLGIPETFVQHGEYQKIMDQLGLTSEKISKRILAHFQFNSQRAVL